MNFKIYVFSEKIEKFYLDAIKEYEKRLSRYCRIQLIEVKNKEQFLKKLSEKTYKIILTVKGTNISSEELASKINSYAISSTSDISIIIGDAYIKGDEEIALSFMEMNAGLKATIIFEQIYRAYRILNNEPYHK